MESVMKRFGLFTKLGVFSRESEQEVKVDCGELLEEIHGVERQMVYNEVWFSAECDEIKKSINLVLNSLGNANKVEFYSDEVVYRGTSKYMAITIADGVVITACDTKWEIFNNTEGMSNDGTLTVSDSTNDYIAVVKVFGENKNLLKKIRLLSVN